MNQTLGYIGVRAGVGLVGLLPRRVAVRLGTLAGKLAPLVLGGRREMVRRHGRRLGVPEAELSRHVREVFGHYGRYWAEVFWTRPRRRPMIEATTELVGVEPVQEAIAAGRGMVFAVPHIGNWEFAGPLSTELGFELVAVAERLANPKIRDWFVELRRSMDIDILFTGRSTVRVLEEAIRGGKGIALLCDRDLKGRGVPVNFFGETTTLPAGPVRLALKTGSPLFPVAVYFAGVGHRIEVRPPIALDDLTAGDGLEVGTQRLAIELEELIKQAPAQWHLLQPNWPADRQRSPDTR